MHRFNLKLAFLVLCIVLNVLLISQVAFADDLKAAKDERLDIENQIKDTIQIKEFKEETVKVKETRITLIEGNIAAGRSAMTELEGEFASLVESLKAASTQAVYAAQDLESRSVKAKETILRLYKNSKNTYISFVSSSGNLFEMIGKISYVGRIIDADKEKIHESLVSYKMLTAKKEAILSLVREKDSEIRDMIDRIGTLETSRSGVERELHDTFAEIIDLEKKAEDLKEYSSELIDEIKELQKNTKEYVGGKMLWPVPSSGYVVSRFGMRLHPIYKVRKMHTGIDIAASYKKNIVAANDGIVVCSGYINGYGYTVIIDHGGGVSTLYGHCSKLKAKTGDLVFKGDLIALIGSSGTSTGPHCHFEVRVNGVCKNPFNYLE